MFCKVQISIPLKIETSMHQYFARRYSVQCWYRVAVYSPNGNSVRIAKTLIKNERFHCLSVFFNLLFAGGGFRFHQ